MTTRRLVRRALLAAAVSTATVIQTNGSSALGFETAAKAGSGIQQAQYQPGQAASPPSGTVSQELNRMFQESGQPMPSMRPQDLPNAQGQQSGIVKQKSQTGQIQPGQPGQMVQQKSQPPKKNFLQKFMGKISGQDKRQAESAVVPPVPPGYREPLPAPPVSANAPQGTALNQSGRPGIQGNVRSTSQNAGGQAGNGRVAGLQSRPTPASNTASQTRRVSQPEQAVPGVLAGRNGTRSAPVNTAAQPVITGTPQTPKYTQPGTAPAFMPTQPNTRQSNSTLIKPLVSSPPVKESEPKSVPPIDDEFVDPFADSAVSDAAEDDPLDLDALVLDAVEERTSEENAVARPNDGQPAAEVPSSTASQTKTAAVSGESEVESPAVAEEPPSDMPEANPFPGVTLNESEGFPFSNEQESAPAEATSTENLNATEVKSPVAEGEFGGPAHPVEDFGSNLPAIDLPSVDDLDVQPAENAANQAAIDFPDLDAEETQNKTATTLEQTPATSADAESLIPAGSTVPQPLPDSGSAATPLPDIDAEKLQQASEQDVRLRQQRMILSRSGQTGFKGFCPVALRDRRNLVDASPEFTATFGLQTYSFSTLEAQLAFEAEPSRYAPAAGGSDVVLLVNSGEEQAGLLDYALWHRDRLYLFRSRESMSQFAQNPQQFANQY